jgi:hypothetical protein
MNQPTDQSDYGYTTDKGFPHTEVKSTQQPIPTDDSKRLEEIVDSIYQRSPSLRLTKNQAKQIAIEYSAALTAENKRLNDITRIGIAEVKGYKETIDTQREQIAALQKELKISRGE